MPGDSFIIGTLGLMLVSTPEATLLSTTGVTLLLIVLAFELKPTELPELTLALVLALLVPAILVFTSRVFVPSPPTFPLMLSKI
jgi:hypothetical protein